MSNQNTKNLIRPSAAVTTEMTEELMLEGLKARVAALGRQPTSEELGVMGKEEMHKAINRQIDVFSEMAAYSLSANNELLKALYVDATTTKEQAK